MLTDHPHLNDAHHQLGQVRDRLTGEFRHLRDDAQAAVLLAQALEGVLEARAKIRALVEHIEAQEEGE